MITPLNLSKLTNKDAYQLVYRFIHQIDSREKSLSDDVIITDLVNEMRQTLPLLQEVNHAERGYADTEKLEELDRVRDRAYQFLIDMYRMGRYETDSEKITAYEELSRFFASYKQVTTVGYERESELLASLLRKSEDSPVKEAFATLGLTTALAKLATAQAAFDTAYGQRTVMKSQKSTVDGKHLKKELLHQFDLLGRYLAIRVEVRKEELPTQLLTIYNTIRKDWQSVVKGRKKEESEGEKKIEK